MEHARPAWRTGSQSSGPSRSMAASPIPTAARANSGNGICRYGQREASGPAPEVRQRILSAFGDPVQVHLQLDQLGIGLGQQHVVWQLPLERREFEVVIVVSELEPCGLGLGPGTVEALRPAFVVVERVPLFRRDPGEYEIAVPDHGGGVERSAPLVRGERYL